MENNAKVDVRVPNALRGALERERKRMSKMMGAEVKTSFVVRSLLERALKPKSPASRWPSARRE